MAFRPSLFLLISLSIMSTITAQDRAPHGLAYQNPTDFSPSAYDFFHPNARQDPCSGSNCSPLPLAAEVHDTESQEARAVPVPNSSSHNVGGRVIAGSVFGVLAVVFLAMGVYYTAKTRRANLNRAKAVQPSV